MIPILTVQIQNAHDAIYARQMARDIAELLGFLRNDQVRIATAVSEIARNAWQYANGGTVDFGITDSSTQVFTILVRDAGPGIPDAARVLNAGHGAAGARSMMDSFRIDTGPSAGTVVTMGKSLPLQATRWESADIARLIRQLRERAPQTPLEELHRQNQELLRTLQEIREQEGNWERLYREMETTNRDMLAVHDELSEQNEALVRSETRFRLMVDEVKDYAIFLLNHEGHIATWNVGAERILGYISAEVTGSSGHIVFSAEDRENGLHDLEMHAARESGRAEGERWHHRKDGSRFWGNSVLTALWQEETLVGFVKILRDITAQKQAQDTLEAAYQRERHITEVLQSPLMRETREDSLPGLAVATFYESTLDEAEVGGDFFDAFALPGGKLVLAVGDASGKGLSAALRARQVKELLRAAFALVKDPSVAHVVSELNNYLCHADTYEIGYESGFVTLALVVLEPGAKNGVFLCAGCEPPLLLRAEGTTEVLDAPGAPLAVADGFSYEAHSFTLAPEDLLVLTTDGITEARRKKEYFGHEGIASLVHQDKQNVPLRQIGTRILEGAREFASGRFRDDVCLLLARTR